MKAAPPLSLTLAIHPVSHGFGWIAFEGPFTPYDWGLVTVRGADKNARCLRKAERLLDRFQPETLVLEAFEKRRSARADRITLLGRGLVALAAGRSVEVVVYTRGEVKACFAGVGAVSRQEVAEAVSRSVPGLTHRLPKPRRPWQTENPRMALFSAAALVLTHYQYAASQILDDLSKKEADEDD